MKGCETCEREGHKSHKGVLPQAEMCPAAYERKLARHREFHLEHYEERLAYHREYMRNMPWMQREGDRLNFNKSRRAKRHAA